MRSRISTAERGSPFACSASQTPQTSTAATTGVRRKDPTSTEARDVARQWRIMWRTIVAPAVIDQYRVAPYIIERGVDGMSHTIREKAKLLARVRRIRGQVEAVERALVAEIGCADVLQLVASIRGAVNGLTAELLEDHIRWHVVDPTRDPDPDRAKGAEELIDIVHTYLK
jgi:DNA-binding FrmR family transcriptional regulator